MFRNMYAQWWIADMVKLHLSNNQDHWPQSWEELVDDYELSAKQSGRLWTFDGNSSRGLISVTRRLGL